MVFKMIDKIRNKLQELFSPVVRMDSIPEDDRPAHEIFTAKVDSKIDNGKGYWNYLLVGIYYTDQNGKETRIGEYKRNYSSLYDTFYPFCLNGKYYALYSKDYTATRIMTLPDCQDVCGQERNSWGFCPVEFYVPQRGKTKENLPFAFVAGCVWGDDWSWKIRFIDLDKALKGDLKVDDRFGYIWLHRSDSLKDAIDYIDFDEADWEDNEWIEIEIRCGKYINVRKDGAIDEDDD